jgi:putative transposase
LPRSTFYYTPNTSETPENLALMRMIDRIYTDYPFYGVPRMVEELRRRGWSYNHKRVARLMRLMDLMATVPGPHTSKPHPQHVVYPYLLRNRTITRPNEVWCTDITYIPMAVGFMFLVAIMDWFSRYVLAWELSSTIDTAFCLAALDSALAIDQPEIFNTDQGSQFTSDDWIARLKKEKIQISMDGRGRALDNVFVERLWRTIKYEDIYLRDYRTGTALREGLTRYFMFYNTVRLHQGLEYRTPYDVYRARSLP